MGIITATSNDPHPITFALVILIYQLVLVDPLNTYIFVSAIHKSICIFPYTR